MNHHSQNGRAHSRGRSLRRALIGASALALTACSTDLLTVSDVDIVKPAALSGKSSLPSVLAASIGDFGVAYGGSSGSEGLSEMTGLLADEFINSESFPTRIEVDQRNTNVINATTLGIFRTIETARATTDAGEISFATLDPTNGSRAEVIALNAYTYVLLAESYCSGVPASTINADGSFTYGAPMTTSQLLTVAVAKFDSAITFATSAGAGNALNLARIGKGRALVDQKDYAAAAIAVAAVPSSFRYVINHDENSGRQNNGVFSFAQNSRRFSIPDREGGNGLPFRSVGLTDGRLAVRRNSASGGNGFDNFTPLYVSAKFQNRSAPTPLAEGSEARLIEAEAALLANDDATFLAKLNAARAAAPTYALAPALAPASPAPIDTVPTTTAAKVDLLFQERGFDLFLTAHRLGDLRRLIRQYGRDSESVFPTGAYFKGGVYGPDVNFPIPFEEKNNPNFTGCLDRKA
ncbi:MAG: hypothetical protein M3Z05_18270 [Gemmatimonadota bacterium]|nr:hypothetical protein [Gemmatimonadota bacterium]